MIEKTIWKGATGKSYLYEIYPVNTTLFNPLLRGNYIYSLKIEGHWLAVFIGEGNIREQTKSLLHSRCIKKWAIHIHIHINPDGHLRKAEKTDLLKGNPESYVPIGCNTKAYKQII